ncbi:MAG TPA: DsrE family protein [Burkholderiales bacterium]|nr:DsrE family protein [Burkholderiales bacterium]
MRTNDLLKLLATLLVGALLTLAFAVRADEPIKTVYHLPDDRLATLALNNINNHLSADPGVKIVVVALSTGVRAFTFGAQDAGGRPYAEWVDQLAAKGVEFRICQNSMNGLRLTRKDLIDNVQVVPSGVAEIARLQAREGYVYIHP